MITTIRRADINGAASTPDQLIALARERISDRDVEGLLRLYEPGASFLMASGQALSGHAAIRGALAELLALEPTLTVRASEVLSAGATALVVSDWTMASDKLEAREVRESGTGVHVVRRQPGGEWLILIDHP